MKFDKMPLSPLSPGKTQRYVSQLMPSSPLVRTGTEMEGSCFFHALSTAFKNFRDLSADEKKIHVQSLRKDLAENITLTSWFQIQNGNVAFLQIIEMMRVMIYVIPSMICTQDDDDYFSIHNIDKKVLDVLFHLLEPIQVDRDLLPDWDVECCKIEKEDVSKDIFLHRMKAKWHDIYQENIQNAIEHIEKELDPCIPKMDETARLTVIHKLSDMSYYIFDFVVEKAFQRFQEDIATYTTWINIFHFMYLIDSLDLRVNILFLDASSGLPFEGMRYFDLNRLKNNRPYVILLYFPDYHFESLGERTEMGGHPCVNRLWDKDHPVIHHYFQYLEMVKTGPNKEVSFNLKEEIIPAEDGSVISENYISTQ